MRARTSHSLRRETNLYAVDVTRRIIGAYQTPRVRMPTSFSGRWNGMTRSHCCIDRWINTQQIRAARTLIHGLRRFTFNCVCVNSTTLAGSFWCISLCTISFSLCAYEICERPSSALSEFYAYENGHDDVDAQTKYLEWFSIRRRTSNRVYRIDECRCNEKWTKLSFMLMAIILFYSQWFGHLKMHVFLARMGNKTVIS